MIRNKPRDAAVYGIDIGKNLFYVVGTDRSGQIIQRAKFRRETVLAFFQRAVPAIVGSATAVVIVAASSSVPTASSLLFLRDTAQLCWPHRMPGDLAHGEPAPGSQLDAGRTLIVCHLAP